MKKNGKTVGNVVVAQSGGPTMVINASLAGVVCAAMERRGAKGVAAGRILGARHGVEGVAKGDCADLGKLSPAALQRLASSTSAALGSSRLKPDAAACREILAGLRRLDARFFFYIGGNDSADTARIVGEEAKKAGFPLVVYHVPKTIDNDLRSCDHTPGFGTAATFVADAFRGDDADNRALGGVKINVVMGRGAGFLTAASALARERPGDGPHLIYLPEVPFTVEKFAADVKAMLKKHGRCVVAVSEGIRGPDGRAIGESFCGGEKDPHGNVQISGVGALGDWLAAEIKKRTDVKRVRADTFGYLQRSFPGVFSETDFREAFCCGVAAVEAAFAAAEGVAVPSPGTIALLRGKGKKYKSVYSARPVSDAAKETRSLPRNFIAKNGHDVTPAFLEYARPLVGTIPHCETL